MGLVLTYDYLRIISFILNSEKMLNTLKQFPTFFFFLLKICNGEVHMYDRKLELKFLPRYRNMYTDCILRVQVVSVQSFPRSRQGTGYTILEPLTHTKVIKGWRVEMVSVFTGISLGRALLSLTFSF